jgi:hypothetical protein
MDFNSELFKILEKSDKQMQNDETITNFEVIIDKTEENSDIKTEVFEENNSEPLEIIGEKRKNTERSNLGNGNKKVKEEFVVFEEFDDKQEDQAILELNSGGLNNQVLLSRSKRKNGIFNSIN